MSIHAPERSAADGPAAVTSGTPDVPPELGGTASAGVQEGRGEVAALTGLRIVAALWVVAFHFHFTPMPGVEMVTDWLGPLVTQGALGVDLFFVLSGFVIAWTYLEQLGPRLRAREAGRFVWARVARMWPAYAVVFHLFGVWLVARAVFGDTDEVAYQAVQPSLGVVAWFEQLVGIQMWTEPYLDGASWVGPTWSISAEWLAYLLFPLLAVVFFRLRNLPFVVLAAGSLLCVAPLAAAFVVVGSPYYPYSWLVRILGGFSAGVLAMLAVRRLRGRDVASAASSVATFAAVAVPFVLLAGAAHGGGLHGTAVLLFPVLVGALALADRGPVHHLLTRAPVVHGGRISYALYLVHIPVFEVFWFLSDSGVVPAGGETGHLIALTVFVGTLPVAHLLYTLVERPARRWLRALPTRRTAAPARPDTVEPPAARAVLHIDSDAARRDPETSVLPVITAESDVAATEALPVQSRGPAGHTVDNPVGTVRGQRPAPAVAPRPRREHAAPARPVPAQTTDEPAPAGSARWVLDRLAAARSAGVDGPGDGVSADLVAAARLRSGGPGTGSALFTPTVDGPGAADRVERLRSLQAASRAGRPDTTGAAGTGTTTGDAQVTAGRGGVVPAPRAIRSAAALPGSRSGAEHCGRAGRRRDDSHSSAATPIVAASGAAARRRRKRPAHGA
ncbi:MULTISPECIES: acyltransferase [unclassified Pseudonocardia]|uniref:acyltransferase n=1 Tax=unclassified Pseudonocardia TaxID=2619320 RepID=UPI000760BDD8|nr:MULTISPECIES: acyltransferase [unclassified Pseudonocardia]